MGSQGDSKERLSKREARPSEFKKGLFVVAGTISLGLGTVGIALPVLPTTPFLLLSAACYYKGSERLHRWMLNNRLFGEYLRNYKEGKGIPPRTKIFTLTLLWSVISFSALFMLNNPIIQIILFTIAIGVSTHIIMLPNFKRT
ncbi:YbaN family protein [Candidatus Bathyarchaeota archaeon]|jgi:uncharacterized membrane protein YbaN (DUF454 family)|nr:YbaN family protein [Candidatus Bathyarchaeota archaeon]